MNFETLRMQISEFQSKNTIRIKLEGEEAQLRILKKILKTFDQVPDPRVQGRTTYALGNIILMIFLASLAGSETCLGVEDFWLTKRRLYKKIFKTEEVPSHDTFRRILSLINADILNQLLVQVLQDSSDAIRRALGLAKPEKKIISVDGKQLRRTGRNADTDQEIKDLQLLNVYEQDSETCLFSEPIESKTNEIPHAQRILSSMDLRDCVVTFDAMHMQTKTISIISSAKGDWLGGLKGNQGSIADFAQELFSIDMLAELASKEGQHLVSREIRANKYEERNFYLFPLTKTERQGVFADWQKARSLVCVCKHTTHNVTGKQSDEKRFYLTSLTDLNEAALCIRRHWNIENGLHWQLDTVFYEDSISLSDRNAARNQSIINKACLSLYKRMSDLIGGKQKISKRRLRAVFGWGFEETLIQALTLMDPQEFAKAVIIQPRKVVTTQ